MKFSEETQRYIETVQRQLEDLGVLEDADRENLQFLGEQVELYHRAMKELDETGLTVTDQKGRVVANPTFSVARSCMTQITALLKELSVSCRQRRLLVKSDIVSDESPLDTFTEQIQELF